MMMPSAQATQPDLLAQRVAWDGLERELDGQGWSVVSGLLTPDECSEAAALYRDERLFRKRIDMQRHGYGQGEYKYFAYPLPEPVAHLRAGLYPGLARVANRWSEALGQSERYPAQHEEFL